MKRIIAILTTLLIVFVIYSCAVSMPSWTNIGSEKVYIEDCRDTLEFEELDSVLSKNGIYPLDSEWTIIKYYTPEKEEMTQFVYSVKDTTYVINKTDSEDYIFYKKYPKLGL